MRDLRIIFMGTPDFAVTTLKALVDNQYEVVGVITAPDKPAGRGRKLQQSAVKQFAVQKGLHVLQPTNLKNDEFIETLKALKANLQIVVAFRMLPKVVWDMPAYGTFNLHASLLPDYRGAAPINWAIINGEKRTGVTTFFIDDKIDTGAVILQDEVEISIDETAGELHDKLMLLGSKTVLKTVALIAKGPVKTQVQKETGKLKTAHKIFKETCKIDWEDEAQCIYNKIRGLSPYPAAWCYLVNDQTKLSIKIYKADLIKESHSETVGNITVTKKALKIAAKGGYLFLECIQLPGKKKMEVQNLLNGYQIKEGAKVC